jgi:hypothetical protein
MTKKTKRTTEEYRLYDEDVDETKYEAGVTNQTKRKLRKLR